MKLCFDATRFGFGLAEAVKLAAANQLRGVEYTFDAFDTSDPQAHKLLPEEAAYFAQVQIACQNAGIEITGIRLAEPLFLDNMASSQNFLAMIEKLANVACAVSCSRLFFFLDPGGSNQALANAESILTPLLLKLGERGLKLVLSVSTPPKHRRRSLKYWRSLDPDEWRTLLALMPELSLSFSFADCAWQGIDYLKILPGLISGIEHIEATDIEVNRALLSDSGLFGPLFWRYRNPGKGQLDWGQLIEALKLYNLAGNFSIHLEDEFSESDEQGLKEALESSVRLLAPLFKY